MRRLASLLRDTRGAGAAEFALVLPLLLLLLLGIIDAGRFMWEYNRAEKATQMGVRYAVVTDLVPAALADYSFAVDPKDVADRVPAGEAVTIDKFESASCGDAAPCECAPTGSDICADIGYDGEAFKRITERMKAIYPQISAENVKIDYRNVELGFSGDPSGPDVAALVTVKLVDLEFKPLATLFLGIDVDMPDFRASLTLEDGQGIISN